MAAFALFCASPALAATAKKTPTAQQNRMKECAAQYHQKKIAKHEYRNFMKVCLKKHKTSDATDSKTRFISAHVEKK